MKTLLSLLATVLFSCALIGPAVAQLRSVADSPAPPRGIEGPEIRKEAPENSGKAGTPKTGKKGTRARDPQPKDTPPPPRGVEGPEERKQAPKGTRAKSQQPRHTDSPPKDQAQPEIKQDGGKKGQ
jgi:hypothetical protein